MAEITYDEFQQLVARKLQILSEGQTLPAEYAVLIQGAARSVSSQTDSAGFPVDLTAGVQFLYADTLAELCAAELADEFQIPEPRRMMLKANMWGMPGRSPMERRFRRMFKSEKPVADVDFVKP